MQTSILIADSQRMIREGLRVILEKQSDFEVVAESEDGRHAVATAGEKRPHIALVETRLPRLSGVEAIRRIREVSPDTRCIALSSQEAPADVKGALIAGASGFVPKNASAKELVEAIRSVREGRSYLAPSVADHVVGAIRSGSGRPGESTITSRQREILQLIAEGLSTREIAAQLGISAKTAKTHRANLMGKLGVSKASGLVRFAIREGIVAA